jgi:hypothetical protein
MNWADCVYLMAIFLIIFSIGCCVGHIAGVASERALWWERQARANRRVEALGAQNKPESAKDDEQWPIEL